MKYIKRFNESILDNVRNQTNKALSDVKSKLDSSKKFCHECGQQLELSSSFCDECGTKQENSVTSKTSEIEINDVIMLKDGGTLNIESNQGIFNIDRKIGTKTPYKVTKPSKVSGNPNQIALGSEVDALVDALGIWSKNNSENLQSYIDGIMKTREDYSYPEMKHLKKFESFDSPLTTYKPIVRHIAGQAIDRLEQTDRLDNTDTCRDCHKYVAQRKSYCSKCGRCLLTREETLAKMTLAKDKKELDKLSNCLKKHGIKPKEL